MKTVVIIDSGINVAHPAFTKKIFNIEHYTIEDEHKEMDMRKTSDPNVLCLHGTGVFFILSRYEAASKFISVNAFKNDECSEDGLLFALEYIRDNIPADMIVLSAGITQCEQIKRLSLVCEQLDHRGTIIIAAYSNEGSLTYPAALDSVIGVDYSLSIFSGDEYQLVEDSPINIRGIGQKQRLPGDKGRFSYQGGASFVVPHIAGHLLREMENNEAISDRKTALDFLRIHADKVITTAQSIRKEKFITTNKKAIVFPVEKETTPLFVFSDLIDFSIVEALDIRMSGNCERKISEVIDIPVKNDLIVKAMELYRIPDDIDLVIVGHTNMYDAITRRKIREWIMKETDNKNRRFYFYDPFCFSDQERVQLERKENCIFPFVTVANVPKNRYGKLHIPGAPVLGIFGTGPKQGKFTLQLKMRKEMIGRGYKTASLVTEPAGELLGMEAAIAMGSNSTFEISGYEAICYINEQIRMMDFEEPDIIMVGAQSQSVQNGFGNTSLYNQRQHELILATQPDAYILCVSCEDEYEYVLRTISYLESINNAKVLCLMVFPLVYSNVDGYLTGKPKRVSEQKLNNYIELLGEVCQLPIFVQDKEESIRNVIDIIEGEFAENEC